MIEKLENIIEKIKSCEKLLLTTHLQCDGDGLGAILGLYHSLKDTKAHVKVMTIDGIPKKYAFLNGHQHTKNFETLSAPLDNYDLCLIFDTNDKRLVEPLFSELQKKNTEILFIDHHPILTSGPLPTNGSVIDTTAASTGEMAFKIIKLLDLQLNEPAAKAIYTSICFDTQLFRFVKSSATSHLIAAELLQHIPNPELIHQHLFSTYTVSKTKFLSEVLGSIEFSLQNKIAVIIVQLEQLNRFKLDPDESRDIIDMVMNINSLEAAVLLREEAPGTYKMSLRSKGNFEVVDIAETFDGGGHPYAAGALLKSPIEDLKKQLVQKLSARIKGLKP